MTVIPQCFGCVHFEGRSTPGYKCKAFDGKIPREILLGEHDHSKPFPGDHGIRFEPKKGDD